MQLEIIDLEEFSESKAVYVKLGKYKINVNDIPLKIALKIDSYSKMVQKNEDVDIDYIINDIVVPIIERQHKDIKREDILEDFNYDQLLKVFSMVISSFYTAGGDANKEGRDKKKE